jgi:hypothetical protein
MSALREEDPLNPHDPIYYAPRALRERPMAQPVEARDVAALDVSAMDLDHADAELAGLAIPSFAPYEAMVPYEPRFQNPQPDVRRHPLDPVVFHEAPGLARYLDRQAAIIRVANWVAPAAGVSIVLALFLAVSQPDNGAEHASGLMQTLRSLMLMSGQADATKSAMFNAQAPLSPSTASEAVTREQSEALLREFLKWRQQPAADQAGRRDDVQQ